jgi:FlaG/FlaF family flagellin (archaellin)
MAGTLIIGCVLIVAITVGTFAKFERAIAIKKRGEL